MSEENKTKKPLYLPDCDRIDIIEILERRANDIASFKTECTRAYERNGSAITDSGFRVTSELPGSIELALSREIQRLRNLADKLKIPLND